MSELARNESAHRLVILDSLVPRFEQSNGLVDRGDRGIEFLEFACATAKVRRQSTSFQPVSSHAFDADSAARRRSQSR